MPDSTSPAGVSSYAEKVAEVLLEIGAVQLNVKSPFTWASGIKSPIYCDNRKIISNVRVRNYMTEIFTKTIQEKFPEAEVIAGVATGGIPLGVLIADRMQLPFIYVRQAPKEHGLKQQIEGSFSAGNKIVLIEDLISTGGSSLKAVKGVRDTELILLALVSIMTYDFSSAKKLFQQEKVPHFSLCNLDAIVLVAKQKGLISEDEKQAVLNFRQSVGE